MFVSPGPRNSLGVFYEYIHYIHLCDFSCFLIFLYCINAQILLKCPWKWQLLKIIYGYTIQILNIIKLCIVNEIIELVE